MFQVWSGEPWFVELIRHVDVSSQRRKHDRSRHVTIKRQRRHYVKVIWHHKNDKFKHLTKGRQILDSFGHTFENREMKITFLHEIPVRNAGQKTSAGLIWPTGPTPALTHAFSLNWRYVGWLKKNNKYVVPTYKPYWDIKFVITNLCIQTLHLSKWSPSCLGHTILFKIST